MGLFNSKLHIHSRSSPSTDAKDLSALGHITLFICVLYYVALFVSYINFLEEINPEYFKELMLKLKFKYLGHLMRKADLF